MRILVIGYGSMGRRRIRVTKALQSDAIFCCVDMDPERRRQAEQDGNIVFVSLEEALENNTFDCAFVCTSPGEHDQIIIELIKKRIHVFCELNLVSRNYSCILKMAQKNDTKVFMSSSKLYNQNIIIITDMVKRISKPVSYLYHVGQYLPDWHPWEDYKNFFAGKKETNGVREILAIQMPWIIDAFGEIETLKTENQNITDLEIDFPDIITTVIKHVSGTIGVIQADVVSRCATTSLEVIGEDIYIRWGGHYNDLFFWNSKTKKLENIVTYTDVQHEDGYSEVIIENQYVEEVKEFLDFINNRTVPKYSLEKDMYTLSIIDRIEHS